MIELNGLMFTLGARVYRHHQLIGASALLGLAKHILWS
jgi:hypothetical protein